MNVKYLGDSLYAEAICQYLSEQPLSVARPSIVDEDLLAETIYVIIVGSKELRYGPLPEREVFEDILKVIKDAIHKRLPIPVLVPWGGRKAVVGQQVDIAEISALKQLALVNEMVRQVYHPGLQYSIRVEDLNALWLYRNDSYPLEDILYYEVEHYCTCLESFISLLLPDAQIALESKTMNRLTYTLKAAAISRLIYHYLKISDRDLLAAKKSKEWEHLVAIGWKGDIPKEQRDYYRDRYRNLCNADNEQANKMLADYLAGSKARYDLGGRGNPKSDVNGFIQINFAHPVPGAPEGFFNTTLHYRTIPLSQGRTHIAPWRAKGYFSIEGGKVSAKVTGWNSEVLGHLQKGEVSISSIKAQADYITT